MAAEVRARCSHAVIRGTIPDPARLPGSHYEGGNLRLHHYAPVEPAHVTPILLVYALTKRAFILDRAPDRSVVQSLARQGFDVYLTDWIPPADGDSWRGLDAYVNNDLVNAARVIVAERRTNHVSIIGYCLGALLAVIYAALHPDTYTIS